MGNFIKKLKDAIVNLLSGPIEFGLKKQESNTAVARRRGNIIYLREPVENESSYPRDVESNNNIIELYKRMESKERPQATEAIVVKPQHMMDTIGIIEHLRGGRMCFVDLESLNGELAQRIATRLSNACAELGGTVLRIDSGAFCCIPYSDEYKTSSQ
jgi:FtsZ-interacting cell division protein YlmF